MEVLSEARMRLIETGGRTSQDLGAGRIVGQVLVYLYLKENACSLDSIGEELGLSKASVSIAARQLEQLGLIRKIWKVGDRKNYYCSADNITSALQKGLLSLLQKKVHVFGDELEAASKLLSFSSIDEKLNHDLSFLQQRISRASNLQRRLDKLLNNPLVRLFVKDE